MRPQLRLGGLLAAVAIAVAAFIFTAFTFVQRSDADPCESLPTVVPFDRVGFRVAGDTTKRCALLAATDQARQEGMQGKSSLMGYDAMVFSFPQDTTVSFINHFVPIDLAIGWYDADGRLVGHTTMPKCADGQNCPTYASPRPFRYAVETPAGELADLGLTRRGATLRIDTAG